MKYVPAPHNCIYHGHVWLETDGTPYTRHRGRSQADVAVICRYCETPAMLPGGSQFSGERHGQPIDHTIPPAFKKVLKRALDDNAKWQQQHSTDGPVPKSP